MNRKIEALCPVVAAMCRTFIEVCKQKNIEVIITSTLRTDAEQLAYFAQGRKSLAAVNELRHQAGMLPITLKENRSITKLLTSIHQFGCAFDCAIAKEGTAIWEIKADVNENQVPDYREIGLIGEAIGFRWGGRFGLKPDEYETKFGWDLGHFEYTGGLKIKDLEQGARPHEGPSIRKTEGPKYKEEVKDG